MIPLKNVTLWTRRPSQSGLIDYLSAVEAHAGPVPQADYQTGTAAILESDHLVKVEVGIDIKKGDTISRMTHNGAIWDQLGTHETLLVTFARDSAAGALQHRRVYCKRITAGG